MALDGRLRERIRSTTTVLVQCTGKTPYETQGSAWRAVVLLAGTSKRERASLHAYRCGRCHCWHVGHVREVA